MPDTGKASVSKKSSKSKVSTASKPVSRSASQEKILKKRGYTLGKLLGEGSYAKVYLSEYTDPASKRTLKLACKVIDGTQASKEFLRKFFPREIEIMSKVNHQYLIRVHSILERKQKYFIFMQYADNGDLLDFIRSNGPIKEKQARIWFAQVVKGLTYLHEKDIAHRDMKCENLLLTAAYNIKISDFGFARYVTDSSGKTPLSSTFCGSVSYAPPEIIRGVKYNCKLADLWSIGVILYVMLNKAMPFDDSNLKKLYDAQVNRWWKIRSKLKDVLSEEAKRFLYLLLEPVPSKRLTLTQVYNDPWLRAPASETALVRHDAFANEIGYQQADETQQAARTEEEERVIPKRSHSTLQIHKSVDLVMPSTGTAPSQSIRRLQNLSPIPFQGSSPDSALTEFKVKGRSVPDSEMNDPEGRGFAPIQPGSQRSGSQHSDY